MSNRVGKVSYMLSRACVFASLLANSVHAEPLPEADLSPLIANIGLARMDETAALPPARQGQWRLTSSTASHSSQNADGVEMSLFDGETTRISLATEWRVAERISIGVEVPYFTHSRGALDGVVEQWHDWFGFPNNLRDLVPRDQIDFRYSDNGVLLLDNQRSQRGVGDIRLTGSWIWQDTATSTKALRVALKLPTGDSDQLTGSGAADIALGLVADHNMLGGSSRWTSFYRVYAVVVGKPDRLASRARRLIGQVNGGLSFLVHERLTLTAQATIRSQAYDSDLRMLGDTALLLNVGGSIKLGERLRLAIAVGEDVRVDTAPDVTLALALRYTPQSASR